MKTLLIIGAGGHGKVVAEIAEENGFSYKFLDDNSTEAIGKICDYDKVRNDFDACFIAIGNNELRERITRDLNSKGAQIISLVANDAFISKTATIGKGTIVGHKAIINTGSTIGNGCIISIGVCIDHNTKVGDYVHINTGAICKSGAIIPDGVKIDAGQIIGSKNNEIV